MWMAVSLAILFICGTAFGYAVYMIWIALDSYSVCENVYDMITDQVREESEEDGNSGLSLPSIDFDELEKLNPDIIGWLYCPDTPINYPVLQGADNSFYLTHLADGSEGIYGAIFLDFESSFEDRHSIIYGHHMKNRSMFASLTNYSEQRYYDEHPTFYLITRSKTYEISLFSGFTTTAASRAFERVFDSDSFREWIQWLKNQSDFQPGIVVRDTDRVMIFSTCAFFQQCESRSKTTSCSTSSCSVNPFGTD